MRVQNRTTSRGFQPPKHQPSEKHSIQSGPIAELSLMDLFGLDMDCGRDVAERARADRKNDTPSRRSASPMVAMPNPRTFLRGVLVSDSKDNRQTPEILVPDLLSDLVLSPVWQEEDFQTGARSAHVPSHAPATSFRKPGTSSTGVLRNSDNPLARVRPTSSRESRTRNPTNVLDPDSSSRIETTNSHFLIHQQGMTDTTMIGPNYLNPKYQQSQTWSDSASRPKSRSIAIKRDTRSCADVDVATTEESERMYDWATWRMYNRIVDHRRNQPRYESYTSTSIANEGQAVSYNTPSTKQTSFYQPQESISDYGEVFELDI